MTGVATACGITILWLDVCTKMWFCLSRAVSTRTNTLLCRFNYKSWCNVFLLCNQAFGLIYCCVDTHTHTQRLLCTKTCIHRHIDVHRHKYPHISFLCSPVTTVVKSDNWIKCFHVALCAHVIVCIALWTHWAAVEYAVTEDVCHLFYRLLNFGR